MRKHRGDQTEGVVVGLASALVDSTAAESALVEATGICNGRSEWGEKMTTGVMKNAKLPTLNHPLHTPAPWPRAPER